MVSPGFRNSTEEAKDMVCDLLEDYRHELAEGGFYLVPDPDAEHVGEVTKRLASAIVTVVKSLTQAESDRMAARVSDLRQKLNASNKEITHWRDLARVRYKEIESLQKDKDILDAMYDHGVTEWDNYELAILSSNVKEDEDEETDQ